MNISNIKKLTTASMMSFALISATITPSMVAHADTTKSTQNSSAAKRLNSQLIKIKAMSANFTQTTRGSKKSSKRSLNKSGTFKGKMVVKRANNLYWKTTSPSEQLIVVNRSQMWIYDKDLEQATKQNPNNQVGNTPALLLSGDSRAIAKNFKITQPKKGKHYYKLYPKKKSSNLKSLSISFKGGKPALMLIQDGLGQVTSIRFSNVKINPKIKRGQFNFTVPQGVDVIKN